MSQQAPLQVAQRLLFKVVVMLINLVRLFAGFLQAVSQSSFSVNVC